MKDKRKELEGKVRELEEEMLCIGGDQRQNREGREKMRRARKKKDGEILGTRKLTGRGNC